MRRGWPAVLALPMRWRRELVLKRLRGVRSSKGDVRGPRLGTMLARAGVSLPIHSKCREKVLRAGPQRVACLFV